MVSFFDLSVAARCLFIYGLRVQQDILIGLVAEPTPF